MAAYGAASIRQLLAEGIEQISGLPPNQPEAEVGAFHTFKRGVTQASSGREAPPDELLADLEPKDVVLRFLVGLLNKKPMYRKQISTLASVLLTCSPWFIALRADEELCAALPKEIAAVLRDAEEKQCWREDVGHGGREDDGGEEPQPTARLADRRLSTQKAMDLLSKAQADIEALGYAAVRVDDAVSAFEAFQRAVQWAIASPQKEDDEALERMKPKHQILAFIIDFHIRKPRHRLRVAALFFRLLGFETWRAAVLADPAVRATVWEMTKDPELEPGKGPEDSQQIAVSLEGAVQEAVAQGCAGAAYVRVIAAHNLVEGSRAPEEFHLHVSVAIGGRLARTQSVSGSLSPRWMATPFLLPVPAQDSQLRIEVLDSDFDVDESFGSLEMPVADMPTEPGSTFSRHALAGVAHGDLELELILRLGVAEQTTTAWLVPGADAPAVTCHHSSMVTNALLLCPVGHEVNKCKEGLKSWGFFGRSNRACNLCSCVIPPDTRRWRCSFHCDFNVCDPCHQRFLEVRPAPESTST